MLLREVLEEAGLTSAKVAESMGVRHVIFKALDGMQVSSELSAHISHFE